MIPIALILLLIVIVFSIAVVVSNPTVYELSIFGAQIPVQTAGVYFTGAGAMLVLIVALGLLRVGWRRSMARRKQVKTLKKAADGKAPKPAGSSASSGSSASTAAADRGSAQPAVPAASAGAEPATGSTPATAPSAGSRSTAGDQPSTTAADREALLAEVDEATRDDPKR
jgi:hypothetical protein